MARSDPFQIRDCALISIATGLRCQNLREFLSDLRVAPISSIYHHFWGRLLQPTFDEPEYSNDFAAWAWHGLHEKSLAERLGMIVSSLYGDLEDLRQELIDIVETRLDETEMVPWAKADQQFYFLTSQMVVLDTGRTMSMPEELPKVLRSLSAGSIFYHLVDARRRPPEGEDDFSAWLDGFGSEYADLRAEVASIDPHFVSLAELRSLIAGIADRHFGGSAR